MVAVAAIIVSVYALMFLRQRRMMYFVLLCIAIALHALGYFFETTATTLDAALIGVKITYLGSPLVGTLFYLFSRDYMEKPPLAKWKRAILFSIAFSFTICVWIYPWVPIYYSGVELMQTANLYYLVPTPGVLYYPCFLYIFFFMLLGIINLLWKFFSEKRYEGAALFLTAVLLPFIVQILSLVGVFPRIWIPTSTALVISIALLFFFLLLHRQPEWQSTGRDLVVENMQSAFVLVDRYKNLLDFNKSAKRYFPALDTSFIGLSINQIEDFPLEAFETDGVYQFDFEEGSSTLNLCATTTNVICSGLLTGTYVLIVDDTENQKMLHEISLLARRDDLTGLNNRATFFHDATMSFDLNMRQENRMGCVLMMDIDLFKDVNDTYGHAVGDEVLRTIGGIISKRFRRTDVCGRYGGEELCAWMPSTTLKGAVRVAEEIREKVKSQSFKSGNSTFSVTISIGVASMHESSPVDFDDLIGKADVALYEAKHAGRDRVYIYQNEPVTV